VDFRDRDVGFFERRLAPWMRVYDEAVLRAVIGDLAHVVRTKATKPVRNDELTYREP
jgi:hypothetical protein